MITSVMSLLAYLLPIIIDGIMAATEKRKGADYAANIQEYRKVLHATDTVTVSALHGCQHDRVLAALRHDQRG